MKRFLLALFVSALISKPTLAEDTLPAVTLQKVSYLRSTPPTLQRFLPKGGKSRFWGASNLKYKGQIVWMHVYDVQKARFPQEPESTYGLQESGLDLFLWARGGPLQKLSSTRFTYKRPGGYKEGGIYEPIGVKTLWLDPQTKKKPIVQIAFQNPEGFCGLIEHYVLAVFDQGLSKVAITQRGFGEGVSNSSTWNSWSTQYEVGEKGLLRLVFSEGSSGSNRDTSFRWTGAAFEPYQRKEKSIYESPSVEHTTEVGEPLPDPGNFNP